MALTFDFPLNQMPGFDSEETRTVPNAYLVVDTNTISLAGIPQLTGSVFYSKAFWQAGAATPLLTETFQFAVVIKEDGKTYAVNMQDPTIAVPFQSRENGVVDIESTAYLYLQALFGGVID